MFSFNYKQQCEKCGLLILKEINKILKTEKIAYYCRWEVGAILTVIATHGSWLYRGWKL